MSQVVHEVEVRVRYQETDGQRRVHHANYLTWFEIGRTELLRAHGYTYRAFEESGLLMVVSEASVKYRAAAEYDDLLTVRTRVEKVGSAFITHAYEVIRGTQILATGTTTVVCVDAAGRVRRLPEWLARPRQRPVDTRHAPPGGGEMGPEPQGGQMGPEPQGGKMGPEPQGGKMGEEGLEPPTPSV